MGLSVVIGGQYGGEGKGAIAAYLAHADKPVALVKTGGPNSAHTFGTRDRVHRVRMVPSGTGLGPELIVFPAGCLVHAPTLLAEIELVKYAGAIAVDPNAGIVDQTCIDAQLADTFYDDTGSTRTGTGAAAALRARRRLRLASEEAALAPYLRDTAALLQGLLRKGAPIVVEGAQGYGLSNYHGQYPYVTSRDCTLGAALSQIGLGPRYVDAVVLVVKCFPTRNKEGRGRLLGELDLANDPRLAKVLHESGGGSYTTEDIPRRVGLFDTALVERAIWANSPTALGVTGLDRLAALAGHPAIEAHYGAPRAFLAGLARQLGVPVALEGWGPAIEDVCDQRGRPALSAATAESAAAE
jgi:adenylosuccinate synthase